MLVLKRNGETVALIVDGGWLTLPDGRLVSPAVAGWSNEDGFALEVAEDVASPPQTIEQRRADAKMSRKEFCLRVKQLAILTPEEAVYAAQGNMPSMFHDALVAAGVDAFEAEIIWATTAEVWRLDPLIEILSALPQIGVALADSIFGIEP